MNATTIAAEVAGMIAANATATNTTITATAGALATSNFFVAAGSGFLVLLVSDFADNSFVALSIFALKNGAAYILIPACVITIVTQFVSVLMGEVLTLFVPQLWLLLTSACFFAVFGSIMIYEGIKEVKVIESESNSPESSLEHDTEANEALMGTEHPEKTADEEKTARRHVWVQMFMVLFVGEMGDRSQLATIALTATTNFWGVFVGGSLGLLVDAAIAVWIGGILKKYVSEFTATLFGGILFVIMGGITGLEAIL